MKYSHVQMQQLKKMCFSYACGFLWIILSYNVKNLKICKIAQADEDSFITADFLSLETFQLNTKEISPRSSTCSPTARAALQFIS